MGEKEEREDRVIAQFCERLGLIQGGGVSVVSRPDRESQGTGGCEAIIRRGGTLHALEHKTVDTFPGQREDSARFRQVVVPVEEAINQTFPDSAVEITVPIGAVPAGQPWGKLTASLISGCKDAVGALKFGERSEVNLPGVPFPVRISRHRKSADPNCLVMRFAPDDVVGELARVLPDVIKKANQQLASYKKDGYPTILLLDTDDFVLITRPQVAEALAQITPVTDLTAIDEVFIAESYRRPVWIYPVKISSRVYPNVVEYRQFLDAQYRLTYGEAEPSPEP